MSIINGLAEKHPALNKTNIYKTKESVLQKGSEILDVLLETRNKKLATVWGYDPNPSNTEHHSGLALDFMVHSDTTSGNYIAEYVIANEDRLDLVHILWRQRIYRGPRSTSTNPKGLWIAMDDRGSATQNHMDHPHILFSDKVYIPRILLAANGC